MPCEVDATSFPGSDIGQQINNAIASLQPEGGTICIPRGNYTTATAVNLDNTRCVTLKGSGGHSSGAAMSATITYTGAGPAMISARSSNGIHLEDLLLIAGSSFTGNLIDFSWAQSPGPDTAFALVQRCTLAAPGAAASLILLNNAIECVVRQCNLAGGVRGVIGATTAYSNAMQIVENQFVGQTTSAIYNAGQAWLIQANTFEALASGAPGAYDTVPSKSIGTVFQGNWFGDSTASGSWIRWSGSGLTLSGNFISNYSGGAVTGLQVVGSSNFGLSITGNSFENLATGIDLGAAPNGQTGVSILGNHFNATTAIANLHGGHTHVIILANNPPSATPGNLGQLVQGGFTVLNGQAAAFPGAGMIAQRGATNVLELQIRPHTGRRGVLSFVEDAVAGRWVVESRAGDANLYFATGDVNSSVDRVTLKSDGAVDFTGRLKFGGPNQSGGGSAALGANCPAMTLGAPYTWIKAVSQDGSDVYFPCWK